MTVGSWCGGIWCAQWHTLLLECLPDHLIRGLDIVDCFPIVAAAASRSPECLAVDASAKGPLEGKRFKLIVVAVFSRTIRVHYTIRRCTIFSTPRDEGGGPKSSLSLPETESDLFACCCAFLPGQSNTGTRHGLPFYVLHRPVWNAQGAVKWYDDIWRGLSE